MNPGSAAIEALLKSEKLGELTTSVFGCQIRDPEAPEAKDNGEKDEFCKRGIPD